MGLEDIIKKHKRTTLLSLLFVLFVIMIVIVTLFGPTFYKVIRGEEGAPENSDPNPGTAPIKVPDSRTVPSPTPPRGPVQTIPAINIPYYEKLPELLVNNQIVADLPSKGSVLLKFFNFDTGKRFWEKRYLLKKDEVKEVRSDVEADLIMYVHSKHLPEFKGDNFCDAVKKADNAGDVGFDATLSKTKLLWRYKGMLKYRSCFGL